MANRAFEKCIDQEVLISCVQNRPVIWDKTVDIYKDKTARIVAWREICSILMQNFEDLKKVERLEFEKYVIKKWTHIRDAWIRTTNDKRKSKKSGSYSNSKPYRYHNQMLFLYKIFPSSNTHDSILVDDDTRSEDNSTAHEEAVMVIEQSDSDGESERHNLDESRYRVKRNFSEEDSKRIEYIYKRMKQKPEKEDRNLSFFKGILPSLASLDDDQILEFQSGVINLIQIIKSKGYQSNYD